MFMHFAYGSLGRHGKINEQTERIIEFILEEKRLKVSKCKEFIPAFPIRGAKRIPREKFKITDEGLAATFYPKEDPNWLDKLPDDKTIHYLPMNVSMVCFIKISFNHLKTSTHSNEYGKFGLAFTNSFLKSKGMKPVYYYTENSLWRDSLILKWNRYAAKDLSKKEKAELEKEIVAYRKPATLFPSFKESVITKLSRNSDGLNVEYLTYDRYEEYYDFKKENEHRIVFEEGVDYLYFNESDLYMIITPNSQAKNEIETYLNKTWNQKPQVKIFPS